MGVRRLASLLHIQPGETGPALLVSLMVFIPSLGSAIGLPGMESLFFTRYGVERLPVMYIWVGLVTIVLTVLLSAAPGDGRALYRALPLVLVAILGGERIGLAFGPEWVYPIIYLSVYVVWTLQTFVLWGTASTVFHARQAKRLFPLFAAAGILGSAVGGWSTRFVVAAIGTENLMLAWAASLLVAFVLALVVLRRASPGGRGMGGGLGSVVDGFRLLRSNRLVLWLSLASTVIILTYFLVVYPFSVEALRQFPDEEQLASFFGLFSGTNTAAAFLISLLLASRFYSRFGLAAAVVILPLIFLGGFIGLAAGGGFAFLVGFRFIQLAWQQGGYISAFQALFNLVPEARRERARQFADGIAGQIGTILAGVLLVVASGRTIVFLAIAVAILGTVLSLLLRASYRGALAIALREGRAGVFYPEEEPFGGFRWTSEAIDTAILGITDRDPHTRLVAAEILGRAPSSGAVAALASGLDDPVPAVRAGMIRALTNAGAAEAVLEIEGSLSDPDPDVRLEAVRCLPRLATFPRGVARVLDPLVYDTNSRVRVEAAVALAGLGRANRATEVLEAVLESDDARCRRRALNGLTKICGPRAVDAVRSHPAGPDLGCRAVALSALVELTGSSAVDDLVAALADREPTVLQAAARGLERLAGLRSEEQDDEISGELPNGGGSEERPLASCGDIRSRLLALLDDERRADGALFVLSRRSWLSPDNGSCRRRRDEAGDRLLRRFAQNRSARARRYADYRGSLRAGGSGSPAEGVLLEWIDRAIEREARRSVLASGILCRSAYAALAVDSLSSREPAERGVALEALDSMGERDLVAPVLALLESTGETGDAQAGAIPWDELRSDDDYWVRLAAEAAFHAAEAAHHGSDDAEGGTVRNTAALSTMERIIFLQRLPLFRSLSPEDLKRIADICREFTLQSGEALVRQGEPGTEMYVIASGELSIRVRTEEGGNVEIARRSTGEPVGEMAILSGMPRMATMVADGPVTVLSISRKEFEEIMRSRPEVSLAVIRVLCERLREAQGPSASEPAVHPTGAGRLDGGDA